MVLLEMHNDQIYSQSLRVYAWNKKKSSDHIETSDLWVLSEISCETQEET